MDVPPPRTLAVDVHPHSPTQRVATYYPMVSTAAGRWADVTWVLHRHRLPASSVPPESTRWREAHSPDPRHSCYRHWASQLAAGGAAALAAHTTEGMDELPSVRDAARLSAGTPMVAAGQFSKVDARRSRGRDLADVLMNGALHRRRHGLHHAQNSPSH